jgi:site-specific DNA-methyltransferase (adenine-specific)
MKPFLVTPRVALIHGDASDLCKILAPNSVDSIVCDPPAGISFMGREWDSDKGGRDSWIDWLSSVMVGALRVLKPGGHALVWALPRTSHWTATALENAGFEIRDRVSHFFGSGFPKSVNPAWLIDKRLGHKRKSTAEPITAEAKEWEEFGSALKPACEDWWLVRKPLEGTLADNVLKYRTGLLNIGGCRIGDSGGGTHCTNRDAEGNCRGHGNAGMTTSGETIHGPDTSGGRYPNHVVLDETAADILDAQTGVLTSGERKAQTVSSGLMRGAGAEYVDEGAEASSGGASRFFYVAKAARSEKEAGLGHLTPRTGGEATGREDGSLGVDNPRAGAGRGGDVRNFHPTVKAEELMRWLVRLITPPGGLVLDMFAGSGTTGIAALAEGMEFIGVEMTDEYLPILEGRIKNALERYPK